MAGFEVTLYGRFWVIPEDSDAQQSDLDTTALRTACSFSQHLKESKKQKQYRKSQEPELKFGEKDT